MLYVIVKKICEKIANTQDNHEKLNLILTKINRNTIKNIVNLNLEEDEIDARLNQLLDSGTIGNGLQAPLDCTTPIALAMCLPDVDSFKLFVDYFTRESINDPNHFVWGYRQLYSYAHLAIDPENHFYFFNGLTSDEITLIRTVFIQTLAKQGHDFNYHGDGDYQYLPLEGGVLSGNKYNMTIDEYQKIKSELRKQLVLYGADPFLGYQLSASFSKNAVIDTVSAAISLYILHQLNKKTESLYLHPKLLEIAQDLDGKYKLSGSIMSKTIKHSKNAQTYFYLVKEKYTAISLPRDVKELIASFSPSMAETLRKEIKKIVEDKISLPQPGKDNIGSLKL